MTDRIRIVLAIISQYKEGVEEEVILNTVQRIYSCTRKVTCALIYGLRKEGFIEARIINSTDSMKPQELYFILERGRAYLGNFKDIRLQFPPAA